MAKMKQRWILRINSIIASILAVMGITSCNELPGIFPGDGPVECKYGIPYSTLVASGDVTNEAEQPIEGIQVRYVATTDYGEGAVLTDSNGHFTLSVLQDFGPEKGILYFEDIDGDKNGAYQNDSIMLTNTYEGNVSAWDNGTATHNDIKIQLKNK